MGVMHVSPGDRQIGRLFRLVLWAKVLDAGVELLAGAAASFVHASELRAFARWVTQRELVEDPRDLVANALLHAVSGLRPGPEVFAAIFLLSHGLVKLWIVVGLLRGRAWYYPLAIVVFCSLVAYQMYKWTLSHSALLLALSVLDVCVIALTWFEYRTVSTRRAR